MSGEILKLPRPYGRGIFYALCRSENLAEAEICSASHDLTIGEFREGGLKYKQTSGSYPNSLEDVGLNSRYCLLYYCYDIIYQASIDQQNVVMVATVNDPYIIFFSSECPNVPIVDEEHASICATLAFKEDYDGNRIDRLIYMKDDIFLATPSAWPALK